MIVILTFPGDIGWFRMDRSRENRPGEPLARAEVERVDAATEVERHVIHSSEVTQIFAVADLDGNDDVQEIESILKKADVSADFDF